MRQKTFVFSLCQTLFDRTFHTRQARTELIFSQLTDATNATIAQVVNIIDFANTIAQINQGFHHIQNIGVVQNHQTVIGIAPKTAIEFHSTHA